MSIAEPFDVRDYARSAHGSLRTEFDRTQFGVFPLDREAIVATAYLRGLERSGVALLRAAASSRAEPRLAEFVSAWAGERRWIVEALDDVLAASPRIRGISTGGDGDAPTPGTASGTRRHRAGAPRARGLIERSLTERMVGPIALVSALDAHVRAQGYRRLAHLSLHPEMERLVGAIVPLLERHADFFTDEAGARLADSRPARAVVRAVLPALRLPLAEPALAPELAREGRELVFGGDHDDLARIDLLVGRRFGIPSTAAARAAAPHVDAAVRVGRLAGATLAELEWSLRRD